MSDLYEEYAAWVSKPQSRIDLIRQAAERTTGNDAKKALAKREARKAAAIARKRGFAPGRVGAIAAAVYKKNMK